MTTTSDSDRFAARFQATTALQDAALSLVSPHTGDLLDHARLCGGTALSRFYLKHRISYDLDFFIPEGLGFDAQALADRLAAGVKIFGLELTHDAVKAEQLHFFVSIGGEPVKLSFVEDMYASAFTPVASDLVSAGKNILTEPVQGLYHRKLRTVVGWAGSSASVPAGGLQTARDMFDLFVLSQCTMPLKAFIASLPYAFPLSAFEDGLANMRWFDLMPELTETIAAPAWQHGLDIEVVQRHLYEQIGMFELPTDEPEGDGPFGAGHVD